jgi:glycosyltransferase involved in cell wall biosynthesis
MKITFLLRSLLLGGSERQLITLAKGIRECGHLVRIIVFYSGGPLEEDLRGTGVELCKLNKGGRWDLLGFFLRLIRLLREESTDILHGYLVEPNLATILMKPLFSRIKMVWGVRASYLDWKRYDWFARETFRLSCLLSRWADLIIVNSRAGKEHHFAQGIPEGKMTVIPNGIDLERFCPDPVARKAIRNEWNIKDREKLIGLIARMDPMKDYPTFLQAAALLAQERNDVRFACVGDGPRKYKRNLQRLGEKLGLGDRILWVGPRVDMPAIYNSLDIASSSSSYGEGFPNVIGEAMASGIPCVVTDVGDSAWIVGNAGIVVPPRDPESLARAWQVSLGRLEVGDIYLREEARQRIALHFSSDKLVERTLEVLSGLL